MKLEFDIVKAIVLLTSGPDKVFLETKFRCPYVPAFLPEQPALSLRFDATYNTGEIYCKTVLFIQPEVIDVR